MTEVAERALHVMELRWGTSRRDGDNEKGDEDGEDGDEDEDGDGDGDGRGGEDGDEYEGEDMHMHEDEDEDNDEDEEGSERHGISAWNMLGEDFEREAASAMGLSSSSEPPYLANNILAEGSLGESDLALLRIYTLKVEDHLSDRTFSRLSKVFPDASLDTLKMTKKRVRSLAGFHAEDSKGLNTTSTSCGLSNFSSFVCHLRFQMRCWTRSMRVSVSG